MVADPVSASIGVASAAIQFFDFSVKAIKLAKIIYKSGHVANPETMTIQVYVQGAKQGLDQFALEYAGDSTREGLVRQCRTLISGIEEMLPASPNVSTYKLFGFASATGRAIEFLWKKSEFDDKLIRLAQLRQEVYSKFQADELTKLRDQNEGNHKAILTNFDSVLTQLSRDTFEKLIIKAEHEQQMKHAAVLLAFDHSMRQHSYNYKVVLVMVFAVLALILALSFQQYQLIISSNENQAATISRYESGYHTKVLSWLSETPMNFTQKHQELLSTRVDGTGDWVFEQDAYKHWASDCSGNNSTLLLQGIHGSGKTILASTVINDLKRKNETVDVPVAYVYCDYESEAQQTPENILSEIIKQIAQRRPVSHELSELYAQHMRTDSRPLLSELTIILRSELRQSSTAFVVVDAVDELANVNRERLLRELSFLKPFSKFMFTSQPHVNMTRHFPDIKVFPVTAKASDITRYVLYRLSYGSGSNLATLLADDPQLRDQIVETVSNKSQDMFLLARLHMNILEDLNVAKSSLRAALKNLPEGLDAAYRDTMARIDAQPEGVRSTAQRVLQWLVNVQRPITIVELQQALAVKVNASFHDPDSVISEEILLGACKGLVVIESAENSSKHIIRLVHASTHEFLKRHPKFRSVEVDLEIARICLTFIFYESFAREKCQREVEEKQYPFLLYAVHYWPAHVRGHSEEVLAEDINRFISDGTKLSCAYGIASKQGHTLKTARRPLVYLTKNNLGYTLENAPEAALEQDLADREIVSAAMEEAALQSNANNINTIIERAGARLLHRGVFGMALDQAARIGDLEVVTILLQAGANIDGEYLPSASTFYSTVEEYLYRYACAIRSRSNPNPFVRFGDYSPAPSLQQLHTGSRKASFDPVIARDRTPLLTASQAGTIDVMRLLLENKADVNKKISWQEVIMCGGSGFWERMDYCHEFGYEAHTARINITALHGAAFCRSFEAISLLVSYGADLEAPFGRLTPLQITARDDGNLAISRTLIDNGANIHASLSDSMTPLEQAVAHTNLETARRLLERGAAGEDSTRDDWVYLARAVALKDTKMVALLLGFGILPSDEVMRVAVLQSSRYVENILVAHMSVRSQWKWWFTRPFLAWWYHYGTG